jgi:hypothetical protein
VLSHIYDVDVWFFILLNFVEMTWTTLIYTWKRNVVSKGDSEEKWIKWWCKRSKKLSMSTVANRIYIYSLIP